MENVPEIMFRWCLTYDAVYIYIIPLVMTFTLTRKNTDQAYTELMKLKFNMHVSTIDEDLYGYQKSCFQFVRKKILAFNMLKKNAWFSGK